MICKYCGSFVDENAVDCPHCRRNLITGDYNPLIKRTNYWAIVGLILSILGSVIGFIVSIIAFKKAKELDGNGRNMAVVGILIGGLTTIVYFSLFFWI